MLRKGIKRKSIKKISKIPIIKKLFIYDDEKIK